MLTRSLKLGVASTLTLAVALTNAPAFADEEPTAADVAAARALGQEGVRLADNGNCPEAVEKLQRAERIFHAPTTLTRLGECQIQMGKLVDGTESLNKVVREQLAGNAPAAFAQAQERAKKLLAETKPRIARLKIAVAGPPDVPWTVKVDGEPMPLANLNMNRPMDPGEHVVEATAPGYKVAKAKVNLPEGGTDSVALTLEVDPNAPKPEANPAPAAPGSPQPTTQETPRGEAYAPPPSRVPAYVALGVGVVGVGVGAAFGVLAMGKKSDLDDACSGGVCPASARDTLDSGETFGTVSTVGFIVGAVGLVAGTYLLLSTPSSSARVEAARPLKRGVYVGVDHVGLKF